MLQRYVNQKLYTVIPKYNTLARAMFKLLPLGSNLNQIDQLGAVNGNVLAPIKIAKLQRTIGNRALNQLVLRSSKFRRLQNSTSKRSAYCNYNNRTEANTAIDYPLNEFYMIQKQSNHSGDQQRILNSNSLFVPELTNEEMKDLLQCMANWRTYLTDDHTENIDRLTERIICYRNLFNTDPDPLFCVDSEITRKHSSFGTFAKLAVAPIYEEFPKSIAREILSKLPPAKGPVRNQLEQIAETGYITYKDRKINIAIELLLTLQSLIKGVNEAKQGTLQLGIISLIRPHSSGLHSQGRAVDIDKYQGKRLNAGWPNEAFEGTIALIDNLPKGYFVLGLPRVPRADSHDFFKYPYFFEASSHNIPIFKRPYRKSLHEFGLPNYFLNRNLPSKHSPGRGNIMKDIEYFENQHAKNMFLTAIKKAKTKETNILYIFPDEPNHVHLSTGETAESMRNG